MGSTCMYMSTYFVYFVYIYIYDIYRLVSIVYIYVYRCVYLVVAEGALGENNASLREEARGRLRGRQVARDVAGGVLQGISPFFQLQDA